MRQRLTAFSLLLGVLLAGGCTNLQLNKLADARKDKAEDPPMQSIQAPPAPRINPMTHIAAGQMLEKQGDLDGAIEQYEKAVTTNPRLTTGYNRLGIVYQKMARFDDADQMFRQGIEVQPRSAMMHNNLGYNFLLQKKFSEAEQSFREALSYSPDFKRARMNLAITLAHENILSDSVAEFGRVVPADVAYFNVAAVCLQKKDYANCEASLRQALAINPNCPGARDQLQRVTRLAESNPMKKPPTAKPTDPLAGNPTQETAVAP